MLEVGNNQREDSGGGAGKGQEGGGEVKNERREREDVEMEKMDRVRIPRRGARKEDGETSKQSWRPGRAWRWRINGHWPDKKRCVMGPGGCKPGGPGGLGGFAQQAAAALSPQRKRETLT